MRKLECSWESPIDINGLDIEDRNYIRKYGISKWLLFNETNSNRKAGQKMSTAITPQLETKKPTNILKNAMFLSVSRSFPPLIKTIPSSELNLTVNTDQRSLHHQKDLFKNSRELKAILANEVKLDNFIKHHCLPFPLKGGISLLPKDLYSIVENELTAHVTRRQELVTAFVNMYQKAIDDAKVRLGTLFKSYDYLPKEAIATSFKFNWQYLQFGVSDLLEGLDKEIAERENLKMESQLKEATDEIQQMLRVSLQELTTHFVERLTSTPGQKKVLRNSVLDNMTSFLTTFGARNLTGDSKLEELVTKAKALMNGVSTETIKNSETLRDNLQKGFFEIKQNLDTMIVKEPMRTIRFED